MSPNAYLILSAVLFCIGLAGVLIRRSALVMFMSIEVMLNAGNLALVTFAKSHAELDGQVAAFFAIVVAAAEVVVGLAIIVTVIRAKASSRVDEIRGLQD